MKIFPKYDADDRSEETKSSLGALLIFAGILALCCVLFWWGGSEFPPSSDGTWNKIRWIAAVVGLPAFFLTCQALLAVVVAATLGPERFIALFFIVSAVVGLGTWIIG